MQLQTISKERYRKHYNKLLWAVIVTIFPLALSISHFLRMFTSQYTETNFLQNLGGPVIAALIIGAIIGKYRSHPAMSEIMYVWNLKQQLNKIYRKQRKVLKALETGDRNAMIIMNFSYRGSKQLYELDDNTITMEDLDKTIAEFDADVARRGYTISTDDYKPEMLKAY